MSWRSARRRRDVRSKLALPVRFVFLSYLSACTQSPHNWQTTPAHPISFPIAGVAVTSKSQAAAAAALAGGETQFVRYTPAAANGTGGGAARVVKLVEAPVDPLEVSFLANFLFDFRILRNCCV